MFFIFDIDGTICFNGRSVSRTIRDFLHHLQTKGHSIGFASARHCRDILSVLDERFENNLLIGANGAMTRYRGQNIAIRHFPEPLARRLLSLLHEHRATSLIDGKWNYSFAGDTNHLFFQNIDTLNLASRVTPSQLGEIIKILVLSCHDPYTFHDKIKEMNLTLHAYAHEEGFDITTEGVNKMTALEAFGIRENEFICFGNDTNDLPLFEKAHYSVVVGDHEQLNNVADERISFDEKVEDRIIEKLEELVTVHA